MDFYVFINKNESTSATYEAMYKRYAIRREVIWRWGYLNSQWHLCMTYEGSVACKSPCCRYYYYYTLKYLKPLQGEGQGEEHGSTGEQGKHGHIEIFTYSQTDFLALSAWERWCQIHSFLCRRENAMRWQWAQNRTKRKCLNLGPFFHRLLFHGYGALELFSFCEFLQSPPPPCPSSLSPLCHFNRRIFTFNANPKGGSASETRVQSITCFHWCSFRNYKCFLKPIRQIGQKNEVYIKYTQQWKNFRILINSRIKVGLKP